MTKTLILNNFPEANIGETSELNADAAVDATELILKDNQGFTVGDFIIIGGLGTETAELRTVGEPNSDLTGLTITEALKLHHDRFDQVTKIFGESMKIYRAISSDGSIPSDEDFGGAYSIVSIDTDQMSTRFTDTSGDADNKNMWYKRTFYNSVTQQETPLAEAVAYRGTDATSYATTEQIRIKAGLQHNRWLTDEKVLEKIRVAQSVIDGTLTGLYAVPFTAPVNQIINEIAQLLAAGYLLQGLDSAAMRAQGDALIAQATNKDGTGWLDKLNKKELKMTGLAGETQTVVDAGGFNAWPNADTARTAPEYGGGQRKFRVSDRY
jgi:hypothetical protein